MKNQGIININNPRTQRSGPRTPKPFVSTIEPAQPAHAGNIVLHQPQAGNVVPYRKRAKTKPIGRRKNPPFIGTDSDIERKSEKPYAGQMRRYYSSFRDPDIRLRSSSSPSLE